MNRLCAFVIAILFLLAFHCLPVQAETQRERYVFAYDPSTQTPTTDELRRLARKKFIEDFLRKRLSPKIVSEAGDRVEIALDPPEDYLTSFKFVSASLNSDRTQVTMTVEGEVDMASLVAALVQNKVITFGRNAPKVMFLSANNADDQKAAEKLRALAFERIRQAGLQPVVRGNNEPLMRKSPAAMSDAERQALLLTAREYGADYVFYISTEADAKTVFSGNGYLTTVNLTYTILRPNGAAILGESVLSAKGQGTSRIAAFDMALTGDGDTEGIAPQFAKKAVGQLYQAIFSDSDVVGAASQPPDQEKTLAIEAASPAVVQAVIANLKAAGMQVSLLSGISTAASRFRLQTSKSDLDLYELLNNQSVSVSGKPYRLSVAAYTENNFEVEAVAIGAQPRRKAIVKPPAPKPQRQTRPDTNPRGGPVLTFALRNRQY